MTPPTRRPDLRRLRAGVAVAGALAFLATFGALEPPTAQTRGEESPSTSSAPSSDQTARAPDVAWTLAQWNGSVSAEAESVTAAQVLAPDAVQCRPRVLQRPRIVWTPPQSGPAPEGYIVEIRRRGVLSPEGLISSETYGPETTQVTLSAGLLEVLEDLLDVATRYSITVRTQGPGEWTSEPSAAANFRVTLGLVPSCG